MKVQWDGFDMRYMWAVDAAKVENWDVQKSERGDWVVVREKRPMSVVSGGERGEVRMIGVLLLVLRGHSIGLFVVIVRIVWTGRRR